MTVYNSTLSLVIVADCFNATKWLIIVADYGNAVYRPSVVDTINKNRCND